MFEPRTEKPTGCNKYYICKPDGHSPCCLGNPKYRDKVLTTLPNCVGWTVGRFNEIAEAGSCKYLGSTHAAMLPDIAKQQNLVMGTEPKVGAAIIWSGGSQDSKGRYMGHCAIVEKVISPTEIVVSQSGYNSSCVMWSGTHYIGNGDWTNGYDERWMKNKYKFKCFIYQPKEVEEMTDAEFEKMMDHYLAKKMNEPSSQTGKIALEWAKKNGYILGDNKGRMMAKSFLTREQFAIVLKRIFEKR